MGVNPQSGDLVTVKPFKVEYRDPMTFTVCVTSVDEFVRPTSVGSVLGVFGD